MGRTLRAKRGVVTNMVGAELFRKKFNAYEFDGSTMFATMADWTPLGLPFEVSVVVIPLTVDNTNNYVLSNSQSEFYFQSRLADNKFQALYRDGSGSPIFGLPDGPFVEGDAAALSVTGTPVQGLAQKGGEQGVMAGVFAVGEARNVLNRIAARASGVDLFHGPIARLRMKDNSPIHGTDVVYGNATRYGVLDEVIALPADAEFTIEWEAVFQKGNQHILGDSATQDSRILLFNSTTNMAVYFGGVQLTFTGVMANIVAGQHYRAKLTKTVNNPTQGTVTLELDGVEVGSIGPGSGPMEIFKIVELGAAFADTFPLLTDSALQNIRITDITNDREWLYTLDEGIGNDIINTGKTQGNYLDQPLWDTVAMIGNGARSGDMPAMELGDNWWIELDMIYQGKSGTQALFAGDATDYQCYATDNDITLALGGVAFSFPGSATALANGQHVRLRLECVSQKVTCYVDDISFGDHQYIYTGFEVNKIGRLWDDSGPMPGGSALQKMEFINTDTGDRWYFPLDEGSGTTITNTDPVTGGAGSEGNWTPDTDWQTIGPYSNDGKWTPDSPWTNIPDNSRYYPMNEGDGDTFRCVDGTGKRRPEYDATIQNYNADSWKIWPE